MVFRFTNEFLRTSAANGLQISSSARAEIDKRTRASMTDAGKLKLCLKKCNITDSHLRFLFLALDIFPTIFKLDISGNDISTRGLEAVSNSLQAQLKYISSVPIDNRLDAVFLSKIDYGSNRHSFDPRVVEEVDAFSGILLHENAKVYVRKQFKKLHGQVCDFAI